MEGQYIARLKVRREPEYFPARLAATRTLHLLYRMESTARAAGKKSGW
jgi:hypothetical protein